MNQKTIENSAPRLILELKYSAFESIFQTSVIQKGVLIKIGILGNLLPVSEKYFFSSIFFARLPLIACLNNCCNLKKLETSYINILDFFQIFHFAKFVLLVAGIT